MPHLDEGILHALLDGEIGSPEIAGIEQHLAECEACRGRLEEARRFRTEALGMLESLDEATAPLGMAGMGVAESVPYFAAAMPMMTRPMDQDPVFTPAPARAPQRAAPPARRRWRWVAPIGLATAALLALVVRTRTDVGSGAPGTPVAAAPTTPVPTVVAEAPGKEPSAPALEARRPSPPASRSTARKPPGPAPAAVAAQPEPKAANGQVATDALQRAEHQVVVASETAVTGAAAPKSSSLGARSDAALGKAAKSFDREFGAGSAIGDARPVAISADGAIKTLGGSIRLVDGLTPERYELAGIVVRVIYRTAWGPLALEQWRAGNVLAQRLVAPSGTPEDSVSAWKERIR